LADALRDIGGGSPSAPVTFRSGAGAATLPRFVSSPAVKQMTVVTLCTPRRTDCDQRERRQAGHADYGRGCGGYVSK